MNWLLSGLLIFILNIQDLLFKIGIQILKIEFNNKLNYQSKINIIK